MSNVKRVYVEKKPEFAVTAKGLGHEIRHYLGIKDVTGVRVLIRYDAENISDETFEKACGGVFADTFLYHTLKSFTKCSPMYISK
jgi:phosphoribosylformylglycinamidine synthase